MKKELSVKEIIAITKSNEAACKLFWELRTNPDDFCFFTNGCPGKVKDCRPSRHHRAYYCPGCKEKGFLTVDSWLHRCRLKPKHIVGIMWHSLCKRDSALKPKEIRTSYGYGLSTIYGFQEDFRNHLEIFQPTYFKNTFVEIDEKAVLTGAKGLGRYIESIEGDGSFHHSGVFGILDRVGMALLKTIQARDANTLIPLIKKYVDTSCHIFTDDHKGYGKLLKQGYKHDVIVHSGPNRRFRQGIITTNSIENLFKFLDAHTELAHGCITHEHLQQRCNEVAFKFNYRDQTDFGLNIILNSFSPLKNYYGKNNAA